jgi:FkbM family methyltransferase
MSITNTLKFIVNHPVNEGNKIGSLLRFIKWQLGAKLNPYPIVYPFVENTKILVWKGNAATGNLYVGLDEFEDMGFLLHFLRKDDLFIDVGANIGSYTLLASGVVGSTSIAIEPVPSTFDNFVDNLTINNIQSKVNALNIGLGSTSGKLKFTQNLDSVNHVAVSTDNDTIDVEVKTLDEVVHAYSDKTTLIKIDVEGFETEVLNGATDTLNNKNVKVIIIELIGNGLRYGYSEEKIHEKLLQLGYTSFQYSPISRILMPCGHSEKNLNTIYVRDINFVNERIQTARKFKIKDKEI